MEKGKDGGEKGWGGKKGEGKGEGGKWWGRERVWEGKVRSIVQ